MQPERPLPSALRLPIASHPALRREGPAVVLALGGGLLAVASVVLSSIVDPFGLGLGLVGLFGLVAGLWYGFTGRHRSANIHADDEGLWPALQPREAAMVRWGRIAKVEKSRVLRRLILYDRDDRRLLAISYDLFNFRALYGRLLLRLDRAWPVPPLPIVLRRSRVEIAVPAGLALVTFGLAAALFATPLFAVSFAGLGLVELYWLLRKPKSVSLGRERLVLHYIHRSIEVPWSEVQGVDLGVEVLGRDYVFVEIAVAGRIWPVRLDGRFGWPASRLASVLRRLSGLTSASPADPTARPARSGSKKGSPPRPRARRSRR